MNQCEFGFYFSLNFDQGFWDTERKPEVRQMLENIKYPDKVCILVVFSAVLIVLQGSVIFNQQRVHLISISDKLVNASKAGFPNLFNSDPTASFQVSS